MAHVQDYDTSFGHGEEHAILAAPVPNEHLPDFNFVLGVLRGGGESFRIAIEAANGFFQPI
jgi:hypothetical protein